MRRNLLIVIAVLLSSCAQDLPPSESGPADSLVIRGELSYLQRIALPPDAVAWIELRAGAAPSGEIVAQQKLSLHGQQVPVDFALAVERSALQPGRVHAFRGAIRSSMDRAWVSDPVAIDTESDGVDVGTLMLGREEAPHQNLQLECGELRARVIGTANGVLLEAGGKRHELASVEAASGARYRSVTDGDVAFWNKGDRATVRIAGESWPECAVRPAAVLVARGNEPGWRLDLDTETLTLSFDYGEHEIAAATPTPVIDGGLTSYGVQAAGWEFAIAVHDEACTDDMTGMPHPKRVIIAMEDRVLRGCGGQPEDLLLGEWVIEDVDGRGIVDASLATVVFDRDGRIGGRGSCNSYGGSYALSGEGLSVTALRATLMACVESLMRQEQRIFAILEAVNRFEFDDTGALILHSADGRTLTARRS